MDTKIMQVLDSCRSAKLYMRGNKIEYANRAAVDFLGAELAGRTSGYVFPCSVPKEIADGCSTSLTVRGKKCAVCFDPCGSDVIVTLLPEKDDSQGELVSQPMLSRLSSHLCNIDFSMRLLWDNIDQSEKEDEYVSVLYHNYQSVRRIVGNLRSASELRRGDMPFAPVVADLAVLCSDLVSSLSILLRGKVRIGFSTDIGELPVYMDPDHIERVLLNIITNSVQAAGDGGVIEMTLIRQGSRAVITLSDNGCGIPPEKMHQLFTAYEAADPASGESGSCGLGLCVSKGILELHGGSIMISSQPGRGTKTTVTLPVFTGTLETPPICTTDSRSMDMLLTELSCILSSEYYTESFRD